MLACRAQEVSLAKLALLSHKDVDQDFMHHQAIAHASSASLDGTAQVALKTNFRANQDMLHFTQVWHTVNLAKLVNTASSKMVKDSLNQNNVKKAHTKISQAKLSARLALIPTIAHLDPKLVISASQENTSTQLDFVLIALLDTSVLLANRWISVIREPSLRLVPRCAQSAQKVTSVRKALESPPLATTWRNAKQAPQRTETE